MKKIVIPLIFLFISFSLTAQNWLSDYDKAMKVATQENKNIIMVFEGSDWCAPCMKLEKYILNNNDFKQHAKDNWVLLKLDFPKKSKNKLAKEQQEQNNALAEKYNKNGYFPLVVVIDKKGTVLGETSYKDVTAQTYINELISFE